MIMPANVDGMVREGISAYRAGNKEEARALLLRAVEIDQYNEQAWLWLSAVVETPEEQRTCLENVLTINPNSDRAKQGIDMLDQKFGSSPKVSPTQAEDVMAGSSFTPPAVAAPATHASSDDELPSTIEWGEAPVTASSSASSNYKVNEPSDKEYDDWVSKLNIGGNAPDIKPGLLDDANRLMSITDDEDDERFDPNGIDDLFSSGPFSQDLSTQQLPKAEPVKVQSPLRQQSPLAPAKSSPASPPVVSPSTSKSSKKSAVDKTFDIFEEEDKIRRGGAFVEDYDDAEMEKLDADEFFQYIPAEITATRLPGTNERYPVLALVGLLVMILINVGAVIFFIQKMTGA
jgi:hypothetical protein